MHRRKFLGLLCGAAGMTAASGWRELAGAVSTASAPASASQPRGRRNVLLITADDMNWDAVGAFGCPVAGTTPHIDRLAGEGMPIHYAHVTVAVCQPSRSTLMTGRYPHRCGGEGFDHLRRRAANPAGPACARPATASASWARSTTHPLRGFHMGSGRRAGTTSAMAAIPGIYRQHARGLHRARAARPAVLSDGQLARSTPAVLRERRTPVVPAGRNRRPASPRTSSSPTR